MVVIGVSLGETPCAWCGELSRQMTESEYRTELAAARGRLLRTDAE